MKAGAVPPRCPLSWKRALLQVGGDLTAAEFVALERWLRATGWRKHVAWWHDPVSPRSLDSASTMLSEAMYAQATRELQQILEPRGWVMEEGSALEHAGGEVWLSAYRVVHPRHGRRFVAQALEIEGIDATAEPAAT